MRAILVLVCANLHVSGILIRCGIRFLSNGDWRQGRPVCYIETIMLVSGEGVFVCIIIVYVEESFCVVIGRRGRPGMIHIIT